MNFKQTNIQAISQKFVSYGGFFSGILLGAIYFSTSLAIILTVVVGLLWLLSGQFMHLLTILKQYPVALWSLALFFCLIVGSAYGTASQNDAFSMISKYRELFFVAVLIPFLRIERHRDWVWKIFILASLLTLLGSYLMDVGIFSLLKHVGPSIKSSITHSIFIAFFAFFCLHKIYDKTRYRGIYIVLFGLCLGNLFFVVSGRIGQLIVIALILLFTLQRWKTKGQLLTLVVIIVSLSIFLNFSHKAIRIYQGVAQTQAYANSAPGTADTSMGLRYIFWENSLKLIAEKPLLGHGTGSFSKEYYRIVTDKRYVTRNPHNEFLMITVQLGLLGLLVYLGFLVSQYYYARALPDTDKWLAQGLLVTLVFTSLFNSPFLDHTEGHWFATMIALCFAGLKNNSPIQKFSLI
jgi:O-antigen ligase